MSKNPNPYAFDTNINSILLGVPQKKSKPKKRKSISHTEKTILWELNKSHICPICKQKIHSQTEAELDHTRAHSKGGQKISWAHRACNRVKSDKPLSEIHRRWGIKTKKKKMGHLIDLRDVKDK